MEILDQWIDRQYRYAATAMLRSVSPLNVVKARPGFDQIIRPRRGSVVASPVPAAYDPDPDYFFHWYRDSAVVVDALRLLLEDGMVGPEAVVHFADFVQFSLSLASLDGRALVSAPEWRASVAPDFKKFLRTDADLGSAHGDAVSAETRVNPDGTLDISNWARPQNDGPALRALVLLRWLRGEALAAQAVAAAAAEELLLSDLAFTSRHCRDYCFDIWEEEKGSHYYTLHVAAVALEEGADWLEKRNTLEQRNQAEQQARLYRSQVQDIRRMLDGYWLADKGYYRSRILESGERSAKELDIAVILAAIHAPAGGGRAVRDERMHATLSQLESLFEAAYPINRDRPPARGPALGRYAGDVYYSGGAYYFSTLGAAEFCFQAARGSERPRELIERGNAYLETVRAFTPPNGEMSEQFDQKSGQQTSAKHLAWSYAAFISCVAARRAALAA